MSIAADPHRRRLVAAIGLTLAFAAAAPARADEPSLWLSTVARWYRELDGNGRPVDFNPVDTYLRFSWTEAAELPLDVQAYLRGRADLAGSRDVGATSQEDDFDVLYGYLRWRPEELPLTLAAGRQYQISGVGYFNFDGATLSFDGPGGLELEAFGGLPLRFRANGDLASDGSLFGGSVRWHRAFRTRLALDYVRQRVAHEETLTGDDPFLFVDPVLVDDLLRGASRSEERVGLDLFHAFGRRWSFIGNAEYNLGLGLWSEARGRVEFRPTRRDRVTAEVFGLHPDFPLFSIWNVFSVEPYVEYRAEYSRSPRLGREIYVRLARQRFTRAREPDGDRDGLEPLPNETDVADVGARIGLPARVELDASAGYRTGFGGGRAEARVRASRPFLDRRLDVWAALDVNRFDNAFRLVSKETVWAFWGGVRYERRWLAASVQLAEYLSALDRDRFRVTATLDLRFGGAVR